MTALTNEIAKRLGGLPADPDGMNGRRSDEAENAIDAFEITARTDREDTLADLLCNLMHWCDRNDTDFANELARAQRNYDAETDGETSMELKPGTQAYEQFKHLLGE